jgi:hypothetical protein
MVAGRRELHQERVPASLGRETPPRSERVRRRERVGQERNVGLAATTNDGDEQLVEGPEVVVELEPGLGFHSA